MQLDWKAIIPGVSVHSLSTAQAELDTLLKEVFIEGLGTMSAVRAELKLKKNASPKFFGLGLFHFPSENL